MGKMETKTMMSEIRREMRELKELREASFAGAQKTNSVEKESFQNFIQRLEGIQYGLEVCLEIAKKIEDGARPSSSKFQDGTGRCGTKKNANMFSTKAHIYSHFQKGSGCFKCEDCGKMTRKVEGNSANEIYCIDCINEQEKHNYYQDSCKDCKPKAKDEDMVISPRGARQIKARQAACQHDFRMGENDMEGKQKYCLKCGAEKEASA
jgi:hypothetical protein